MKKGIIGILFALSLGMGCLGLAACNKSGGGNTSSEINSETEEAVTFYFEEKQIELPVGASRQTALQGLEAGETVVYESNDETVATVDANGVIQGVKIGAAVIKATTSAGRQALMSVTVLDNSMLAAPYIRLSKTEINICVSDTYALSAELCYKGEKVDGELSWTSDNESVATVQDGVITAVGKGNAKIIVSAVYKEKTVTASVKVSVSESELMICPDYAGKSVVQGETLPLNVSATRNGESVEIGEVHYALSDTSIAMIENGGLLARSGGDVTVTASFTFEGKAYECVTPVHVYGEHSVTVYSFEGRDRILQGLLYGETVDLSLLNPIENKAVKCWYVNGEKLDGNTFTMLDEDVTAVAKYVNEADEDFADRFSAGNLVNEAQAKASYKTQEVTDSKGNTANGGGYVYFDAPNWGSLQFNFDENVTVTETNKVKMRLYCPESTVLLYFGIGDNDSVVAGQNVMANKNPDHAYALEISVNVWTEIEIPLTWFADASTVISGFSICASSNSYCLLDDIIVLDGVAVDPTSKNYAVTFLNADYKVFETKTDYSYGDTVAIPAATPEKEKEGDWKYEFIGWYDGENKVTAETVVEKNMEISPRFKPVYDGAFYILTVENDGTEAQTYNIPQVKELQAEALAQIPALERAGYEFVGYTKKDGGEAVNIASLVLDADITIVANWAAKYLSMAAQLPASAEEITDESKAYEDLIAYLKYVADYPVDGYQEPANVTALKLHFSGARTISSLDPSSGADVATSARFEKWSAKTDSWYQDDQGNPYGGYLQATFDSVYDGEGYFALPKIDFRLYSEVSFSVWGFGGDNAVQLFINGEGATLDNTGNIYYVVEIHGKNLEVHNMNGTDTLFTATLTDAQYNGTEALCLNVIENGWSCLQVSDVLGQLAI